jgi:hypothetical protein
VQILYSPGVKIRLVQGTGLMQVQVQQLAPVKVQQEWMVRVRVPLARVLV